VTNKKFKLTAAAVALAACAAAQPVSASAADELPDAFPEQDAVVQPKKAPAADTAEINDTVSPSAADAAQDTTPGDDSDPAEEPQPALPVLGPKDTIAYPPAETVQNPDGSTTETTEGPVTDGETGKDKGTADKTETRTDESSTTYDPAGTVVDKTTTENPDGSVTETTTTVSQGTTTTTTTVEGSASSSTSKTETTPKDELDADEELKDITVDWSTGKGAEVGGNYIVTGESELSEDGNSRQLTLTKVTHETGSMEGQDIAKLIDAGYVDNGDGTYTLTKTITDANGRQQQTTVTVDSSTASRTVTTTLIVKVEKSTQHGREDVKQDYTYPPETTLTDGAGNSYTLHIADLLADPDAQRSEDGKTITVQKGSKTYTLTLGDETTAGQAELSNQDLAALMGGEEKGYTVGKDGAIYLTKDGETCKLDADQTALLRKQMKVHVKVENDKGTLGSQQLADGSQTPEQAAAAAKQAALENALTAAAAKASGVETVSFSELTLNANGSYTYTHDDKTYTFAVTVSGETSETYQVTETASETNNGESGTHTVTGSATAGGAVIAWRSESGKPYFQLDGNTAASPLTEALGAPSDATDIKTDAEGRVTEYTLTVGGKTKVYRFHYDSASLTDDEKRDYALKQLAAEKGMTVEQLVAAGYTVTDTSFTGLTRIAWDVFDKADSTETPGTVQQGSSWTITPAGEGDDATYTIVKNGQTYTGLKKDGDTYTSEVTDASGKTTKTTITLKNKNDLTDKQILALLADKTAGASDLAVTRKDGKVTATYTKGQTIYTIDCTDLLEQTLSVETRESWSLSETRTEDEKDDAYQKLWDQIDAIRQSLKTNQVLKVGDMEITSKSTKTDIIQKITTAVSLNNMNKDQLAKILKEQEKLAQDPNKKVWVNEDTKGTKDESLYYEQRKNYYSGTSGDDLRHLDLVTDSTLCLLPDKDGTRKPTDCLIIRDGLHLEWNYDADKLLNNPKSNQEARLTKNIGYDSEAKHYEYTRIDGSIRDNNNPTKSAFYKLTGTVVYDALTDTDGAVKRYPSYDAAVAAYKAAMEAQGKEVTDADIQRQVVRLSDKCWYDSGTKNVWYQVYTNSSTLSAYGYMDVSSNDCINVTKDRSNHTSNWYGGYDLKISDLVQVESGEVVGQNESTIKTYVAPLTVITKEDDAVGTSMSARTASTAAHSGSGWQQQGSYSAGFRQTTTGTTTKTGTAAYDTVKPWQQTTAETDATAEKLDGKITYTYRSEKDPVVTLDGDKTVQTDTKASVRYTYGCVSTTDAAPLVTTTTQTKPGTPEQTPADSLPAETPADTVVPPAEAPVVAPAAPAASTLPQTGVNRLAVLFSALSGSILLGLGAVLNRRKEDR
jgi:hypothetical protein